ncbi:sure-like protein [Auriscalpium vulgare]|uniref:Sure-like protein n=1 Tax=Auriscalpium vulgare TaxID=40419 RepID=A0ACB8RHW6_9AGAM|nr:sure-like protein [Auriscalpium vulgare]
MSTRKLRVLLTNDDGPPGPDSPYIYGLYKHLTLDLGWEVNVVIPSSQKSWIGKAHQIKEIVHGQYYYPRDHDGNGVKSSTSRPLEHGEIAEWILLDGTPATCANIGLHNLYHGDIDLLLSGPNLGRNTSSAFALSSGTIGAALSSSLSHVRSIALSYGTVIHTGPTPTSFFEPAHALSARIVGHLWDNWGADAGGLRAGEVDLYNVNIPMVEGLLGDEGLPILWTRMWRNSYGRLFKAHAAEQEPALKRSTSNAGPDTPGTDPTPALAPGSSRGDVEPSEVGRLVFKFAPDMKGLIGVSVSSLPEGTDGWAMEKGWVSVTPMRASFAEPASEDAFVVDGKLHDRIWKMKL